MDAVVRSEPRAASVRLETPYGSGEMAYLDFGPADRPVDAVFMHANGFNARTYRTILSPLADRLRILAPDQRGHGLTTLPTERESRTDWREMVGDLHAFLAAMGIERVALAGHSMGGTVSILAAAEAPATVSRLALFDPVIFEPKAHGEPRESPMVQGSLKRRRVFASRAEAVDSYRGRGAFKSWTEDMLADYVASGFKDLPDGTVTLACDPEWEVSNYVNQGHDSWGALDRSVCPIHLFRAENGSASRLEGRVEALTASGRIRVDVVPGTTHFLPMERPDIVREGVLEAVNS